MPCQSDLFSSLNTQNKKALLKNILIMRHLEPVREWAGIDVPNFSPILFC